MPQWGQKTKSFCSENPQWAHRCPLVAGIALPAGIGAD
jgi:hypothetical protein